MTETKTNLTFLYLSYLGGFVVMRGAYLLLLATMGTAPSAASTLITAAAPAALVGHLFRSRFGRAPEGVFAWKLTGLLFGIWVLLEVLVIMVLAGSQLAALGDAWEARGIALLIDPLIFMAIGFLMLRLFLWIGGRFAPATPKA